MISILQPLQSVQIPIIKYKEFLCSLLTALPNQYLMLHRHWRINNLRIQRAKELFLQCLTPVWHRDIRVFAGQLEEYSNEAHSSAVKTAIKYSETLLQSQDDEVPDYEGKDKEEDYSRLQNPTKTPIILKDFLGVLPHCPIFHWASQMCNNPQLCFCPCSSHSRPWREKKNIVIDDDHGCKATAMTPQELLKHLTN
jgi:hypothetical protein